MAQCMHWICIWHMDMKTGHTIMDKCVGYLLKSAGSTGKLNQQYIVGSRLNTENPSSAKRVYRKYPRVCLRVFWNKVKWMPSFWRMGRASWLNVRMNNYPRNSTQDPWEVCNKIGGSKNKEIEFNCFFLLSITFPCLQAEISEIFWKSKASL